MFIRYVLMLLVLFSAVRSFSQRLKYDDVLQSAIAHRQAQNAAHVISWNTEHYLLNIDSFWVDQQKGRLTVLSGNHLVYYAIKILGTYDHKDSTFLWSAYNSSIRKDLASPVTKLITMAGENGWGVAKPSAIRCSFDSANKLATLAFYLDNANGIDHIMTNQNRTNVFFAFYEVEVLDRVTRQVITKVPVKKQYKFVEAPALIDVCRRYVTEFGVNEAKYNELYERSNDDQKYLDTLFANRVQISGKYWDTTSVNYVYFRENRLQAHDLQSISDWRTIEVEGQRYVLYDEKEPWGGLKTWAFRINTVRGENKICNEYLCF
jgi:hypothetical protein